MIPQKYDFTDPVFKGLYHGKQAHTGEPRIIITVNIYQQTLDGQ